MGVLNLVVVIITAGVAVIACVFAGLTFRSQVRSEKLQEQTKAIQEEATRIQQETYDSQKRATEIQDRMDARDLEFRKSRANASLINLARRIENIANKGREFWLQNYDESMVNGWHEEVMHLPDCALKRNAYDVFSKFVEPIRGAGAANDGTFYNELMELHRELSRTELKNNCRKAIEETR